MRFEPLGSSKTKQVDVRVVCATNADLRRMVAARTFREDLYYRINLVNLELPPLRSRTDDIALLAEYFMQQAAKANGLDKPCIAPDAIAFLRQQRFPGNIRELKNLVERTLLMSGATTLSADDFRACTSSSPATSSTLEDIRTHAHNRIAAHKPRKHDSGGRRPGPEPRRSVPSYRKT